MVLFVFFPVCNTSWILQLDVLQQFQKFFHPYFVKYCFCLTLSSHFYDITITHTLDFFTLSHIFLRLFGIFPFFCYLNDYWFCSIYSGLSIGATFFFFYVWSPFYHACLIFVHPIVFILFCESEFSCLSSALLRWSTLSNLLFNVPFFVDNPGQRNVIIFLVF